ncbi:hypothetical protein [Sphaerospermopsis aphanizomenoides]|nr:hypothetical protein [Sphaerospermopsis aphanizomenoides]
MKLQLLFEPRISALLGREVCQTQIYACGQEVDDYLGRSRKQIL